MNNKDTIYRQKAIDDILQLMPTKLRDDATVEEQINYVAWRCALGCAVSSVGTQPPAQPEQRWIPCSERLPIKEFEYGRKSRTVYDLYPCLVTRYSTHTDEPKTRTYVCKSYFDGEDFMLHGGYALNEESDTENTLAWMPLPEPWKGETE